MECVGFWLHPKVDSKQAESAQCLGVARQKWNDGKGDKQIKE